MPSTLHRYYNILGFQIPIHNISTMQILKAHYNLSYIKITMILNHIRIISHLVIKSTTTDVFHTDVNVVFVFEGAYVRYYEWTGGYIVVEEG